MNNSITSRLDENIEETGTSQTVIDLSHVSFTYPSEDGEVREPVLRDVSFQVKEGEFIAILGHNGSGKSTLARLLNAQVLPNEGEIHILGMDTREEDLLWEIRSHCGMVFQNPDNQMVASVVEEDVAFGPENLGVPLPELRERVDEALKSVDMYDYRHRPVHRLSGGQKQRVAIAGVLAMLPSCIIMDEPTAMLDPVGRREILETIHHLNKKEGKTILLITHHMDEAAQADRILVMAEGRLALEGKPRAVFAQVETMRALELDVPQVTDLAHCLRQAGFPVPGDCLEMNDLVEALL